jgi:hypothetical protein
VVGVPRFQELRSTTERPLIASSKG